MHISAKFYWANAVLCFCALLAHELLGAPMVLPSLLESGLSADVIWLHHFSWHVGSVAVAGMAAMYICAAIRPEDITMASIATAMSLGFTILAIGLALQGGAAMWDTPAPYIWGLVSIIGATGIATRRRIA